MKIFRTLLLCQLVVFHFCPAAEELHETPQDAKTKSGVLGIIRKVNDHWQAGHPKHGNAFWNRAVYHIGNMAAYEVTKENSYRKFSEEWARKNRWEGARSDRKKDWKYTYGEGDDFVLFGDWQACFQVYIDLYHLDPDKRRIARAREVMDYQISTPETDYLWWSDGLFMVMPMMSEMAKLTGDEKYLERLHDYFSYSKDLMFDAGSGLFFRDAKYVYPKHKSANGKKDFWARGNGWVFAALPMVLDDLPADHPHRQEYLDAYLAMAKALAACQQEDGYWSRSLIDPPHAPGPETSGTAFFTYGFLWGLNHGALDRATYLPVARNAWKFLTTKSLRPDGSIGYIQPIGEKAIPGQVVDAGSTADFGVGAFLLAAAEMTRFLDKAD